MSHRPTAKPTAALIRDRPTWMAYILLGLFAYLETAIGPSMPFIRDRLDLSYTLASLHFSAFASGGVLVGLAGEPLIRRWGRRAALWGGLAGMTLGAVLIALSPSVVGTILGAFAMGWLGTLSLVTNQATLADLHGERRTVALAESNVAASSAAVTAPLAVGGFDAVGLGWQFGLLAALPVFALLLWRFRSVPLPAVTITAHERAAAEPLPTTFWILWAVLFLVSSVEWCVAYWGADFLSSVVGLREAAAATAMSIFFAAMIIGRILGASLTRRYPGTSLLLAALAAAALGFPIFWLAASPAVSLIGLFIAGVGIANFYPLTVAAATTAAPHFADRATTRLAISGAGALLIGPLVVGALSDAVGMRWGFGIVLPFILAAIAATLLALRSSHAATTTQPSVPGQPAPADGAPVTFSPRK